MSVDEIDIHLLHHILSKTHNLHFHGVGVQIFQERMLGRHGLRQKNKNNK